MGRKKVNLYLIPEKERQEERIEEMTKILGLDGATASFRKVADQLERSHATLLDFFENMLEKEMTWREDSRVARWMQQAHFPFRKTAKDFNFSFQPSISERQINEFLSCRFIEHGHNIIFLGPAGVGKTHLAVALGIEAIHRGFETRFLKLDELIDRVEKDDEHSLPKSLRNFIRPQLLILDDMDYYNTGKNASTFLFRLVMGRYDNNRSMIITSNRTFGEWGDLFGAKQRAGPALDRILERAEIVNIKGDSYRIKDKMKKIM